MKISNSQALLEIVRTYFRNQEQDREILRRIEDKRVQKLKSKAVEEEVILYNRRRIEKSYQKGKHIDIKV